MSGPSVCRSVALLGHHRMFKAGGQAFIDTHTHIHTHTRPHSSTLTKRTIFYSRWRACRYRAHHYGLARGARRREEAKTPQPTPGIDEWRERASERQEWTGDEGSTCWPSRSTDNQAESGSVGRSVLGNATSPESKLPYAHSFFLNEAMQRKKIGSAELRAEPASCSGDCAPSPVLLFIIRGNEGVENARSCAFVSWVNSPRFHNRPIDPVDRSIPNEGAMLRELYRSTQGAFTDHLELT